MRDLGSVTGVRLNDEFGDYIIYAGWPEYRVFFDGRSDMYGTDLLKEYLKVSTIRPGWEEILKKYNVDLIFFRKNSALPEILLERGGWKTIYVDEAANILVKDTPKYRNLIEKYSAVSL